MGERGNPYRRIAERRKRFGSRITRGAVPEFEALRGTLAERRIKESIKFGIEIGDLLPPWVTGYSVASKKQDKRGIDGFVHTDVGLIPLQIKSSQRMAEKARRIYPDIPVVVIKMNDLTDFICMRVCEAIAPQREELMRQRQAQV